MNARSKRYFTLKAAGCCPKCGDKWEGETVLCRECIDYNLSFRGKTPKAARSELRARRRWARKMRKARIAAGKCVNCGGPQTESGQRCETCRDLHNLKRNALREQRRDPNTPRRIHLCKLCREPGHDARTCKKRHVAEISIIEFATARNAVDVI